MKRIKGKF